LSIQSLKSAELTGRASFTIPVNGLRLTISIANREIVSSDVDIIPAGGSYSPSVGPGQTTRTYCLGRIFGRPKLFWDDLETNQLTDFQATVYRTLVDVESGTSISYGELAERIGKPGGSQAVGQALRTNPFPVIIPCHRVVRADGSLGGYGGVEESPIKARLLDLESQ
jgi:O-6-methylguanine DNA methyltransferase